MDTAYRVVPANEASWEDLQAVLGTRGPAARCQCQRYRLRPRESFAGFPVEERAERLREQAGCGTAGPTSGLVAHLGDEPVGWCAVAPRSAHPGLVRNNRVPWEGRDEDRSDPGVWAVTCFVTRTGHRRRGVSRALLQAAVGFARDGGARVLEGYPMTTTAALAEELHVGLVDVFVDAGFREVSRPTVRRAVVRVEL